MTTPVPIVRNPGEGDMRSFLGGGIHTWKLQNQDTDGAFWVFEDTMTQGKMTPLHLHPGADEVTFLLEGEIITHIDGVEHHVAAGGLTFVPRGTPHAFVVVSDSARMLNLQTPGVGQEFYRGASDAFDAAVANTVDMTRLRASAEANRDGIEILGPPPFAPLPVS